MQPKLCAAGVQLRDQVDTWFPDRRTASDGWVGDSRHSARKSDHVIFDRRICSKILNWKWRKYKGINPHKKHIHISFTTLGDLNGTAFDIPLIGGKI